MVKRKEEWIGIQEARRIISEQSSHEISEAYVRQLGYKGKIGVKRLDGRTNLYNRKDVEAYRVRENRKRAEEKPAA